MGNGAASNKILLPFSSYVYWGEYPLSFAACLSQEECFRLVLARGADPDNQDTNGNTVLHMLVIYEKVGTFDMAYEMGATVSIRNVQNLTPLTLAAKLARIEMFFHVMNIEREIYWQLGEFDRFFVILIKNFSILVVFIDF